MRLKIAAAVVILLASLSVGCSSRAVSPSTELTAPAEQATSGLVPAIMQTNFPSNALFLDTSETASLPTDVHNTRSRFVKLNRALLLDETNQPLNLPAGTEITINFFPDVTYSGVIEKVTDEGGVISWVGNLKNVEYSYFTIIYTSDVFIGNFGSPAGVYEVSSAGGDLYRVILIDQSKPPGIEG